MVSGDRAARPSLLRPEHDLRQHRRLRAKRIPEVGIRPPRRKAVSMPEVIVYSRKQCHLCDEVKEKLSHLQSRAHFQWREIDIDSDPELQRLYNDEGPVVFIDGRQAFTDT